MALDFAAGCLGGCAGVLVGHPLDTIKVRLQTQDFRNPQYRGTYHCFKSILQTEKVAGLYKGMSSPMAGVAFVNAIVFGVYGNVQRRLPDPDAISSHFLAGSSAGFAQSFICSPMELAKTRLQLQGQGRAAASPYSLASSASGPRPVVLYKNPLDCLVRVAKKEGWRRGVFRGLGMTLAREIPGCGTYFLSYELLTRKGSVWRGGGGEPSTLHMALAGGVAGTISWVLTYPVDVLKSRLQADGVDGVRRYEGVVDCLRQGVREEGAAFLVRGLNSTIIRAFPVNAACFTAVTWVFRLFGVSETREETPGVGVSEGRGVEILREEPASSLWLPAAELAAGHQQTAASRASSQFGLGDFLQATQGIGVVFGLGDAQAAAAFVDPAGRPTGTVEDDASVAATSPPRGVSPESPAGGTARQDPPPPPPPRERSYSFSKGSRAGHEGPHHGDHGVGILAKLGSLREEKIGGHIHLEKEYPSIELF